MRIVTMISITIVNRKKKKNTQHYFSNIKYDIFHVIGTAKYISINENSPHLCNNILKEEK